MSLAFVIEIHSHAVGLAVRDGSHYRFHAAVREFGGLDGQSFRSPQDAERAVRQQAAARLAKRAVRTNRGPAVQAPTVGSTDVLG